MIIKKIVQHTAMLTLAAAVSISASSVHADSVNYIIPFGPGGESDVSARMQQSFYKEKFGEYQKLWYLTQFLRSLTQFIQTVMKSTKVLQSTANSTKKLWHSQALSKTR